MVFLFKNNSIGSIIFLFLLCAAVHAHLFLHPVINATTESSGLISVLFRHYSNNPLYNLAAPFIYVSLILIQAIRLNVLLNDLRMYNSSTFTIAMSYVLLSGILPQWASLTVAVVANSFVIWIFIHLSKLYNSPQPKTTLFNTGLLVGCAFLCYHPTIILIAVALFALAVVRPFVLSEWFVLLLGMLMPVYLFVSFLFLTDRMFLFYEMTPVIKLNIPFNTIDAWVWVKLTGILVMLIIGLQYWSTQSGRMVIQIRKNWGVMVVMIVSTLPIPFAFKNDGLNSAILWIVPLAAFLGNAYSYPKKALVPNILFFFSVVLIVHTNWVMCK